MIPIELQDLLVEELKSLFDGFRLKNVKGEVVPLNIYPQSLPAKQHEDDDEHFPYVIIKYMESEEPSEEDPSESKMYFIAGVYDEDDNNQGYRDAANIINKIEKHLMRGKFFGDRYEIVYPVKCAVNEEDTSPYYFGGLETTWYISKTIPEFEEV